MWWLFIVFLICISIPFWFGKGANAIAGYNTMSKKRKELFDEKKLCRSFAIIFDIMAIIILCYIYKLLDYASMILMCISVGIVGSIIANVISKKN